MAGKLLSWSAIAFALTAACGGGSRPPAIDDNTTAHPPPPGGPPGDASADAMGTSLCPPVPAGEQPSFDVGAQLANINVKDCSGNDVSLRQYCGAAALWIFVADAWCIPCQHVSQNSESLYAEFAGKNLVAVNILAQDTAGNPATQADCATWRDAFGLKNVVTLYDPQGTTNALYDVSTTTLSVFVDRSWLIVDKVHGEDPSLLTSEIQKALTN